MPKLYEAHYSKLAQFLHENPKIHVCHVEMIQRCVSAWDLHYAEWNWLTDVQYNPDCINATFVPSRKYIDDALWDLELVNGLPYYFDPAKPEEKFSGFTKLTTHGEIWKRKPSKSEQAEIQQLISSPPPDCTTV